MRDQFLGDKTYSQNGDDMVIACLFQQLRIYQPSYLDLGAYHPTDISNTALLYSRGSRGVNVEPVPALHREFVRMRPGDVNLNCAVAPRRGKLTMTMYLPKGGSGTFRPEWATKVGNPAKGVQVEVDTYTLDEILDVHTNGQFPHFLSIDVEGMDEEILGSFDFSRRAPVVIDVEAFCGSDEAQRIRDTLERAGFFFLMRCGHNCIYVRNDQRERMFSC